MGERSGNTLQTALPRLTPAPLIPEIMPPESAPLTTVPRTPSNVGTPGASTALTTVASPSPNAGTPGSAPSSPASAPAAGTAQAGPAGNKMKDALNQAMNSDKVVKGKQFLENHKGDIAQGAVAAGMVVHGQHRSNKINAKIEAQGGQATWRDKVEKAGARAEQVLGGALAADAATGGHGRKWATQIVKAAFNHVTKGR